jgi:hypothetical protein
MIKELDNVEISHVYYHFRDYLADLEQVLNSGFRTKKIEMQLPDGDMSVQPFVVVRISDEEVAAIRSSHHYLISNTIVDKLRPIVEMIEEAEPEIKKKFEENE